MSKQALDRKLEALDAVRQAGREEAVRLLGKALGDRNNYYVSKAAALTAGLSLSELAPDLVAAFDRFLKDAAKSDPQCWAKNAIVKALKDLEHWETEVFLRGIVHVQPEPVWGGAADSAATLRGACALALVDCRLPDLEILRHLVDRLADAEKSVRIDAAVAIAQLGAPEGALVLRLKALTGDLDPAMVGQCFDSLLQLAPGEGVKFVAGFLERDDEEVRIEAGCVLAQSREPEALAVVRGEWDKRLPPQMRTVIALSLGASPLREAAEFLVSLVRNGPVDVAAAAVRGLAGSRFRQDFREDVEEAVQARGEARMREEYAKGFREG
ncbi:MAG: hypothetical protein JJE04_07825 [Acidobacteriia bacterium]|nr:hypothetical protein [Terriglobia bacterium]